MEINSFEILKNIKDNDLKLIIKLFYVFKTYDKFLKKWYSNALFVTIDDKVFGFGQNNYGVCGKGHDEWIEDPVIIEELCDQSVKEFFNGFNFVLCLTTQNKLFSWGMNYFGQLGIGYANKNGKFYWPKLITLSDVNIVQVCCGDTHSLVLTEEGLVYGWGDNLFGQTGGGLNGEEDICSPKQWIIDSKVSKIHCSRFQSFAITENGRVYCCGINDTKKIESQLNIEYEFTPDLRDNIENVESIVTSNNNTYFVTKYGEIYLNLYSCEKNLHYFEYICENEFTDFFVRIFNSYENISSLYSNNNLNCLEYAMICVGDMIYELHDNIIHKRYYKKPDEYFALKYQITYKTVKIKYEDVNLESNHCKLTTEKYLPRYIRCENSIDKFEICDKIHENLKKIIKYLYVFKAFQINVLFVTIDDKVFGLGKNKFGVLGLGHENEVKEVEIIPELCDKRVKEFFNGQDFVLCLTSDNKIFSWGKNDNGQLGNGHSSAFKTSKPELIEYFNDKNIIKVCCNGCHSSVLTSDGNVYFWGKYYSETFDQPVKCEFVDEIESIHCSRRQTFCLTKSEIVYYWINDKKQDSLNVVHNIKTICSSYQYTYLISNDTIYILEETFDPLKLQVKTLIKFNFGPNFNAISLNNTNCVIYNYNCVYELYGEEFFITKYKIPFDYYCDKEELTANTIELNVKEEDIINANQTTNYFMINFIDRENDFSNILKSFSIANKIGILKSFIKYFHAFRDIKGYYMLFVTNDNNVYGFGINSYGNCGFGHNNSVSEPKIITELCDKDVIKFFGGLEYTLALTNDNVLYAFGIISERKDLYCKPTILIKFENEIEYISCSDSFAFILMKDGTVYGWGDNKYGQIYDGSLEFISSPLKIVNLPKIKLVTCGEYKSVFVSEENQIFVSGRSLDYYYSSKYEDSEESCGNTNHYQLIKFEDIILNIVFRYFYNECLFVLTTNGKLLNINIEKSNEFDLKFEIISSNVESIYSIDFFDYNYDYVSILVALSDNNVYYFVEDNHRIDTKYKTVYEHFAEEYQITYKTIDIKLQNDLQQNDLPMKGFIYFEIEILN